MGALHPRERVRRAERHLLTAARNLVAARERRDWKAAVRLLDTIAHHVAIIDRHRPAAAAASTDPPGPVAQTVERPP